MMASPTKPAMTLSASVTMMFEAKTEASRSLPAWAKAAVMASDECPVAPPNTNTTIGAATAVTARATRMLRKK